jgi:hypothetical protein
MPHPSLDIVETPSQHGEQTDSLSGIFQDQPGHDLTRTVDSLEFPCELGCAQAVGFEGAKRHTIVWHQANSGRPAHSRSGEDLSYCKRHFYFRGNLQQERNCSVLIAADLKPLSSPTICQGSCVIR